MGKRAKEQPSTGVSPKVPTSCTTTLGKVATKLSHIAKPAPREQYKVVLNRTIRPSRRAFGKKAKRGKRLPSPSQLQEQSARGELFTGEVKDMIHHLATALFETGVLRGAISLSASTSTSRAVAAALHQDLERPSCCDEQTLCRLYGCYMREFQRVADRLSATGGAAAVLAHSALHSECGDGPRPVLPNPCPEPRRDFCLPLAACS